MRIQWSRGTQYETQARGRAREAEAGRIPRSPARRKARPDLPVDNNNDHQGRRKPILEDGENAALSPTTAASNPRDETEGGPPLPGRPPGIYNTNPNPEVGRGKRYRGRRTGPLGRALQEQPDGRVLTPSSARPFRNQSTALDRWVHGVPLS